MLHSHESQQVPWGSAYRKSKPQAPLTLYRIEGESPTPYHGSQAHLTLFPTSANPLFLFQSSQIPYCPHGCGALHPMQAEGMQQGERGRCKQEQKQPRSSEGRDEAKNELGPLLTTTVTLQKDKDGMEDWYEALGICRGREPLPGGLPLMSSLAQEGEI